MTNTHNGLEDVLQPKDNEKSTKISPVFDFSFIEKSIKEDALQHEDYFPVDVFPTPFQDLIIECNKVMNFPTEYIGTAIIAAISTVIGKSSKVKAKGIWYEYASFYMAVVGNAGANKSHPIETAFKPIEDIDRKEIEQYRILSEDYEANKNDKEVQVKEDKPILKKSLLHNFTPEILYQRLTDNERGCALVADELATFLEGMNNYSKGDQTSIYLSIWSNKSTSIDRVSRPVPLWLQQPFLSIIGSLQPRMLSKLFPKNKSDNGFLQRFLFAFPNNAEKQCINDFEINETVFENYSKWIDLFLSESQITYDDETGLPKPKIYNWSKEAKEFFYKWQKDNTDKVNANSLNLKGEILSKFDIHFVRLSLILQIMENYSSNEISLKAVQGAERLCSYFLRCSMKVLDILENGNPIDHLPENKIIFYNSLPDQFTTKEANEIGDTLAFNVRAVQRFLNTESLFIRLAQGQYSKTPKKELS